MRGGQVLRRHRDHKVHGAVGVVLLVVSDERLGSFRFWHKHFFEELLVIRGPRSQRQLGDFQRALIANVVRAGDVVARLALDEFFRDRTLEVSVPRMHLHRTLAFEHESNVCDQISRVEVRNTRRPSRTDAFSAVHQHERENRIVIIRLDALTVFIEVVQQRIVTLREHRAAHFVQASEDVTRARMILTAL